MEFEEAARKHGVPQHRVVTWVRRKLGPDLSLVRWTAHGVGCAAPCVFCTRVLIKYDLRVHCPLGDGGWYSGRMDEPCAPSPVLTSGQRRSMGLEPTPGRPCPTNAMINRSQDLVPQRIVGSGGKKYAARLRDSGYDSGGSSSSGSGGGSSRRGSPERHR